MTRNLFVLLLAAVLFVSPALAVFPFPPAGIGDDSITDAKLDWGATGAGKINATDIPVDSGGSWGGAATNVQDALEELEGAAGDPDQNLFETFSDGANSAVADAVTDTILFKSLSSVVTIIASDVDDSVDFDIADDSIDSEHYAAASIDNEHLADDAVGADEIDLGDQDADVNAADIPLNAESGTYGGAATNVQDAVEELETAVGACLVDLSDYEVDYFSESSDGTDYVTLTNVPIWLPFAVIVNGVEQRKTTDYAVTKATKVVDFTAGGGLASGDFVQVLYLYKP